MTFSLFQARHRDVFEHPEGGKEATKKCNIHKLTAAEHNYDVSNRELLDMKAALKKWKYCLKGVKHPIQVLIDYHNLEYIRSTKRLNLRECRTDMMYVPDVMLPRVLRWIHTSLCSGHPGIQATIELFQNYFWLSYL